MCYYKTMKPDKIFLIRHGESEGNVDKTVYARKPDYSVNLTQKGERQAVEAGKIIWDGRAPQIQENFLSEYPHDFYFYTSPFFRTRQTLEGIVSTWPEKSYSWREDPRLREQEWNGRLATATPEQYSEMERERDLYGKFYYRFDRGESCADVFDRASSFLDTMWRDFEKKEYPRNVGIVSHGIFIRVFLMRWFRMTVEEFDLLCNPNNASIIEIVLNHETKRYELTDPLAKYASARHPHQRPLRLPG